MFDLGGICTRNMGPINEWWTTGFDGGENPVVGFSTAFAEYVLLSPSEAYKPFWDAVADKVQLSKVVIEFLKDAAEKEEMPTYEDLVNRIQVSHFPFGRRVNGIIRAQCEFQYFQELFSVSAMHKYS